MATHQLSTKPIKVGIIGLSASAVTSWASGGHLPNLKIPAGLRRYQIVALCNSSVEAAKAAIQTYRLGPETRTYGSPHDLAADAEVELVLNSTHVGKHYETSLPIIKAGKDLFIEWPIAANEQQIEELANAAKESGSTTIVGLQGRWSAPVLKVKEILDSGRVGKVLSTDARAFGGAGDRDILPTGLKYFAELEQGGNPITIGFCHIVDLMQSVVGEVVPGSDDAHFQLQRPNIRIRDSRTGQVVETFRSTVPDLLSLHGTLPPSSRVSDSATLSFLFRRGQPFPLTPAFTWTLNCERGEIRLVAHSGSTLQAPNASDEPMSIQVHHFDTNTLEDVDWTWDADQLQVPQRARALQKVLYAFADAKNKDASGSKAGWVGIEDGAARARQVERWLSSFKP